MLHKVGDVVKIKSNVEPCRCFMLNKDGTRVMGLRYSPRDNDGYVFNQDMINHYGGKEFKVSGISFSFGSPSYKLEKLNGDPIGFFWTDEMFENMNPTFCCSSLI